MQRFPRSPKIWQSVILVLGVIAAALVRMNQSAPSAQESHPRGPAGSTKTESRAPADTGDWEHLEGCTLVEDRGNDGDSFVLRHRGGKTLFRLYFADCAEKYKSRLNADRVAEQGRDFGGLSDEATVALGEAARDFVIELLRKGPVAVDTRWEKVYDSDRRYAFVTAGGADLAEILVSRGLARIHTKGVSRPGGRSGEDEKARLQQMERDAKAKRLGAWGRK